MKFYVYEKNPICMMREWKKQDAIWKSVGIFHKLSVYGTKSREGQDIETDVRVIHNLDRVF